MEFGRLPSELQHAVFDHLEPDDLISLHRTTQQLRHCINGRGLLPGRVARVTINGLRVPGGGPDEMRVSGLFVVVESSEGVRISTSYPNKRLYHSLDKSIAPGTTWPGYPPSFIPDDWPSTDYRMPMRRYRMKSAAYLVKFARLLERTCAMRVLEFGLHHEHFVAPHATPLSSWGFHKGRAAGLEEALWYRKTHPIQLGQLFRSFRWVGRFDCWALEESFFPGLTQLLGGRPDVFQNRLGTCLRAVTLPGMTEETHPHKYRRDFCEPWPTRAHIWENFIFEDTMTTVEELLPRSASLTPGCLYTHFGSCYHRDFVWDWLQGLGLVPISSDCPSAIYFRDAYEKYVAEEFGAEIETCFLEWPNPEREVLLLFRMHDCDRRYGQKNNIHHTITLMVNPNESNLPR